MLDLPTLSRKPAFVDSINIILMFLSFFVALKIPFTLLLLSYAVLGPLHYLTEIFWLDKNNYYLKNKKDHSWLLAIAILIAVLVIIQNLPVMNQPAFFKQYHNNLLAGLMFIAFFTAVIFILFTKVNFKLIALGITLLLAVWLWRQPGYMLFFGLLLSTVVHVCLFTAAFIFLGALRNKTITSFLSFGVYLMLVVLFFFVPIDTNAYGFSVYQHNSLDQSGFTGLNAGLAKFLGNTIYKPYDLLSENSIRIQCFLAFSYTYHYLNWFSKVDIIRWNKVPSETKKITVITWILALALYWYNYKTGLMALFMLSLVHVFLEFPLNVKSFIDIGKMLQRKMQ